MGVLADERCVGMRGRDGEEDVRGEGEGGERSLGGARGRVYLIVFGEGEATLRQLHVTSGNCRLLSDDCR